MAFVDYVMPNIDGKTLCRIIRERPDGDDIFLVMLSAIAAEEWESLEDYYADACIAKVPFDRMKNILSKLLGMPPRQDNSAFRAR